MPYFNPFREDRMRRMQELLGTLAKIKECDLDWLLGWGGLRWGSTEESILRMLRQLEKARMIEIDNDMHKVRFLLLTETKKKPTEERATSEKTSSKTP